MTDSAPAYTIRRLLEISGKSMAMILQIYSSNSAFDHVEEQTKSINKTLGDAFRDEPFTDAATNGDVEFYGDFHRSTVVAGLLAGEVYVAENASKEIVGVAVWFGPGRDMFDSEDQQEQGLSIMLNRFNPEHQEWFATKFLPELGNITSKQIPHEVRHQSWHLQTLATAPEYQRKGVARAFVDIIKPKAAETGTPLVVETATQENVVIYEKIGFKQNGEPATITGFAGQKVSMWSLSMETAEGEA